MSTSFIPLYLISFTCWIMESNSAFDVSPICTGNNRVWHSIIKRSIFVKTNINTETPCIVLSTGSLWAQFLGVLLPIWLAFQYVGPSKVLRIFVWWASQVADEKRQKQRKKETRVHYKAVEYVWRLNNNRSGCSKVIRIYTWTVLSVCLYALKEGLLCVIDKESRRAEFYSDGERK